MGQAMSLEVGAEVIYKPDGSIGTVQQVHNHVVAQCATVQFHTGPQVPTIDRYGGSSLSMVGAAPPQPSTSLDAVRAAPITFVRGLVTAAEVIARAPINFFSRKLLSEMSLDARTCAKVAAACYMYPNREPIRPLRIADSEQHCTLILDEAMNEELYVVYVIGNGEHVGCPVLGFTGTRFGMPEFQEDVDPDLDIGLCGAFRMVMEDPWIFETVRAVANKYQGKQLILTGHSLGGTRALIAALGGDGSQQFMLVHELVGMVHVFNPGSGLTPHGFNLGGGRLRATTFVHRVFADILSVTNFPCHMDGKAKFLTYSKHPEAEGRHSLTNFT